MLLGYTVAKAWAGPRIWLGSPAPRERVGSGKESKVRPCRQCFKLQIFAGDDSVVN